MNAQLKKGIEGLRPLYDRIQGFDLVRVEVDTATKVTAILQGGF